MKRKQKRAARANKRKAAQFVSVSATIRPDRADALQVIADDEQDGNRSRVARIAIDEFLERRGVA
jgi:hypothetical protein